MADIDGSTSDGFHTFDELYHHRTILFMLLCTKVQTWATVWKARVHADDSMFDGFFIAGVDTPFGQATYHVRDEYWDRFPVQAILRAPEFDGHTPEDTLTRLCKTFIGTEPTEMPHG